MIEELYIFLVILLLLLSLKAFYKENCELDGGNNYQFL